MPGREMLAAMTRCPECGAERCGELFDLLLALDHSWQEPWGPLHGIAAACYFLQHPSGTPDSPFYWALLRAYLSGGVAELDATTSRFRTQNRRGGLSAVEAPSRGARPDAFERTIADLAVDGTFPADGYAERIREWALATADAWQVSVAPSADPPPRRPAR
jgi:hypothetical protein